MKETLEKAAKKFAEEQSELCNCELSEESYIGNVFTDGANWHKERVIEMIEEEIKRLSTKHSQYALPRAEALTELKQQILNDGK